jgi:hypothetical protein
VVGVRLVLVGLVLAGLRLVLLGLRLVLLAVIRCSYFAGVVIRGPTIQAMVA